MIGDDVEVTKSLLSIFDVDEHTDEVPLVLPDTTEAYSSYNLVTRPQSRGVVTNCFAALKKASTFAITGSPGIGKSWTLLYALQQALLYDNATVIFWQQKRNVAYICIRSSSRVFVWHAKVPSKADSRLFQSKDVLILLDPAEEGASFVEGDRMLIYTASNNKKHLTTTSAIKKRQPVFRYLSPWTEAEFEAALPYMNSDIDLSGALERARQVGMLPRYLLDGGLYTIRDSHRMKTAAALTADVVKKLVVQLGEPLDNGEETIAGSIFSVNAAAKQEPEESREQDDGSGENGRDTENPCMGYDGQFRIEYTERHLAIMCPAVVDDVVKKWRETILECWNQVGAPKHSAMWVAVECLFWEDDIERMVNEQRTWRRWQMSTGQMVGEESSLLNASFWTKSSELLGIESLGSAIFNNDSTVCRMKPGTAAIDFAGPGRKVYQVTVSKGHDMNEAGMIDVLIQGGYLTRSDESVSAVPKKEAPKEKLEFYWVVPNDDADAWKRKVPKKGGSCNALKQCLEDHVIQYTIDMKKITKDSQPQGSSIT
jgi:hypothetical protein